MKKVMKQPEVLNADNIEEEEVFYEDDQDKMSEPKE